MRDNIPADLLAVSLLTVAVLAIVSSSGADGRPGHVALGLFFTFFAPGYALVALLIPWSDSATKHDRSKVAVSCVERLLLSVGLSLVVVPAIGLLLSYSTWGLDPVPLVVSVGVVTLTLTAGAAIRRVRLPVAYQFLLPFYETYNRMRTWVHGGDTRWDVALNVVLVVGLVGLTVGVGAAVVAPGQGETYTEFSVQPDTNQDNDSIGELPREADSDITLELTNQEHDTTQYTVVVEFHQLSDEDSGTTIVERQEVERTTQTVEHGESWEETYTVEPALTGQQIRLTALLYVESPPDDPSTENAYRSVYLWVDDSTATEAI